MKAIIRLAVGLAALALCRRGLRPVLPRQARAPDRGRSQPGGPTDVIARIVADKLSATLGKQFYVVNQPGAGGNTATGMVADLACATATRCSSSAPASSSTRACSPRSPTIPSRTSRRSPSSPCRPTSITVHPSVPAKTIKELIELIKANPGKYSFAAPGVGSTPHLSGEIFRITNGLDLPTVQFTGAGPAIQSTVGGHTPVAFTALPPAAPQIKEGMLRALMVTARSASPALPDVPTVAEAGLPGQEAYTLTGIVAPAAHAEGDRRPAASGDRQDRGAARRAEAPRRPRLRGRRQLARRVRGPHQDRDGEVGQGHPRRQDQGRGSESSPAACADAPSGAPPAQCCSAPKRLVGPGGIANLGDEIAIGTGVPRRC